MLMSASPKPPKGTARRERKGRWHRADREEVQNKAESKLRDGYRCRWPWCPGNYSIVHSCHLKHKGMNGDVLSIRSQRDNFITQCPTDHYIFDDVGGREIEPLTDKGTDGPCRFVQRDKWTDEVIRWAEEVAIGMIGRQG